MTDPRTIRGLRVFAVYRLLLLDLLFGAMWFWFGAHVCAVFVFASGVWYATHVQLILFISQRVQKTHRKRGEEDTPAADPVIPSIQSWLVADGTLLVGALLAYLAYPAYSPVFYLGLVLLFLGNAAMHMLPWSIQAQPQPGP